MSDNASDEAIIEERIYTISFSKPIYGNCYSRRTRAPKAVRFVRQFVKKHWKLKEGRVIIDQEVNQAIWKSGIESPPRRIKVRCVKSEEDTVEVFLV